jgi:hypothetical protein
LVASFPCGCGFFSLLWFNFSHTRREWQFAGSILILNRFKLQHLATAGRGGPRRVGSARLPAAPREAAGVSAGELKNGRAMAWPGGGVRSNR